MLYELCLAGRHHEEKGKGMDGERFSISSQMERYLQSQLETGERVLWAGTTDVRGRIRRLWLVVVSSIFLMFLCSFVFWNNPSRWILLLLSALIWAGIPAFVYWRQSAHLRNTLYAVTDRRALILSLGNPERTESYLPEKIEFVQPVVRKGGRGDIYFTSLEGPGPGGANYKHGFLGIEDAHRVALLMRRMLLGK
jgi:hypothetical protein